MDSDRISSACATNRSSDPRALCIFHSIYSPLHHQVLVHGRKIPVSEMCDRIDEITPDDVRRVAHRYFGTDAAKPATAVVMGKEDIGDWRGQLRKYGVGGA